MLAEKLRHENWFRKLATDDASVASLLLNVVPAYARLTPHARADLIKAAIEEGTAAAVPWRGMIPSRVAESHGLRLLPLHDDRWEHEGIRAELDLDSRVIFVSDAAVRDLAHQMCAWWSEEPSLTRAREVIIAHEWFHVLRVAERSKRWCEVEIGAHAFAKEMMQLPVSPLWFDWLTVWERKASPNGRGSHRMTQ